MDVTHVFCAGACPESEMSLLRGNLELLSVWPLAFRTWWRSWQRRTGM